MMPGLDGFALVEELRADEALRAIPIIMLSARAGEHETARGLSSGANDYIAKPFTARELLVRVASSLASARAAEALREHERTQRENLYRLFMQAPFPIAVLRGPRHVIELANDQMLRIWAKRDGVLGVPLAEAIPELVGQPFLGYLDGVFRTGVVHEGRAERARLASGPSGQLETAYFNYVYAPLRDRSGAIEGTIIAAFDVSNVVRAEQVQRQMVEFQERFVAVLGHDLRNPLAALITAAGLLRQQLAPSDEGPTGRVLARISSSALRMSRMVDQILDLTRARIAGGLGVEPTAMDLGVVLTGVVDELRTAYPQRSIELACPVLPGAWDRDRLEQVFSNLIGNAIHHGSSERPVTVTARRAGEIVIVEVHNTGEPIPESLRARLFDPFRRGEREGGAPKAAGLGLGLYISREIVVAHGGDIEVESTRAEGTTFRVSLPRTRTP